MEIQSLEVITTADCAFARSLIEAAGAKARVKKLSGTAKCWMVVTPLPTADGMAFSHPEDAAIRTALEAVGYSFGGGHGNTPYQYYFVRETGKVTLPKGFDAAQHPHKQPYVPQEPQPVSEIRTSDETRRRKHRREIRMARSDRATARISRRNGKPLF